MITKTQPSDADPVSNQGTCNETFRLLLSIPLKGGSMDGMKVRTRGNIPPQTKEDMPRAPPAEVPGKNSPHLAQHQVRDLDLHQRDSGEPPSSEEAMDMALTGIFSTGGKKRPHESDNSDTDKRSRSSSLSGHS